MNNVLRYLTLGHCTRCLVAALSVASLLMSGCDGGGGTGGKGGGGGTGGEGGGGGEPAPPSQTQACARYIDCVSLVAPSDLGAQLDTYGEDGSCWKGSASQAETCDVACRAGAEELRKVDPSVSSCWECEEGSHCESLGKLGCNANHYCVECTENAHCSDPAKPVCSSKSACVECSMDADCKDPAKPACGSDGQCFAKTTISAQCFKSWYGPMCDLACLENLIQGECSDDVDEAFKPGGDCGQWDICCDGQLDITAACGGTLDCQISTNGPGWFECLAVGCCLD